MTGNGYNQFMEILAKAVGRRKEAVAQVQMIKGTGVVTINDKPSNDYLQNNSCAILAVQAPFEVFKKKTTVDTTSTTGSEMNVNLPSLAEIDTIIKVKGGGLKGQADAIRLGIARALCSLDAQAAVNLQTTTGTKAETADSNWSVNADTMVSGLKKQLKDRGFLTQDSRVKERRKYGLRKARKATQYHKR